MGPARVKVAPRWQTKVCEAYDYWQPQYFDTETNAAANSG